jgi:hypothetical protein
LQAGTALDVVSGPDGYVAVGVTQDELSEHTAVAWWSSDGRTWERSDVGDADSAEMFRVSRMTGGYVAVGDRYPYGEVANPNVNRIAMWTSADGRSWAAASEVPDKNVSMYQIALVTWPQGAVVVLQTCDHVAASCVAALYRSIDGAVVKRLPDLPAVPESRGVVQIVRAFYFNDQYTVVGIACLPDARWSFGSPETSRDCVLVTWQSPDLTSWSVRTSDTSSGTCCWLRLTDVGLASDGKLLAVGERGRSEGELDYVDETTLGYPTYSFDGVQWSRVAATYDGISQQDIRDEGLVAAAQQGWVRVVRVGSGQTANRVLLTSPNGADWQMIATIEPSTFDDAIMTIDGDTLLVLGRAICCPLSQSVWFTDLSKSG